MKSNKLTLTLLGHLKNSWLNVSDCLLRMQINRHFQLGQSTRRSRFPSMLGVDPNEARCGLPPSLIVSLNPSPERG